MIPFARFMIIMGVVLTVLGGLILLAARVGLPVGRLPGDIKIERGNLTCIFALGTSILLSILLTIIVNIVARFLNK